MRNRRSRIVTLAASLLSLVAATAGWIILAENDLGRRLASAGLSAERISVNPLTGLARASGIRGRIAAAEVRVGQVELQAGFALVPAAWAAGDLSLRDLRVAGAFVQIDIPHLEARGISLTEGQIRALFDPANPERLSIRLGGLNAQAISATEMRVSQRSGAIVQDTTYRDMVARNVAAGRFETLEGAGGAFTISGTPDMAGKGTFGRWSVAGTDTVQIARVFGETGGKDEPFVPLYGTFDFDDLRVVYDAGTKLTVARVSGDGASARPGPRPLAEIVAAMGADPSALSDEEQKRAAAAGLSLLDHVRMGSTEIADLSVEAMEDGKPIVAMLRRVAFSGGANAAMSFDGLSVTGPGVKVGIASAGIRDVAIGDMLGAMRDVLANPGAELSDIEPGRLIPRIGAIEMKGLDIDVQGDGKDIPPLKATLRGFLLAMPQTLDNIPTAVRIDIDGLGFTLPARSNDDVTRTIKALGYTDIDLSMTADAAWNERIEEVAIPELSASGVGMGSVKISGRLGDVPRDVFAGDAALAQAAIFSATARALDIVVTDAGLVDRWINRDARQQRRKPEEVRRDYGAAAAMLAPGLLGPGENSRVVGAAIGRFIARPGTLTISVRSKDGQGIGLAEALVAAEPRDVLERLVIGAKAE